MNARHPNRAERLMRRVRSTKVGGRDIDLAVAKFLYGQKIIRHAGWWRCLLPNGRRRPIAQYTLNRLSRARTMTLIRRRAQKLRIVA